MKLDVSRIESFLHAVDASFPIPLSRKHDLHKFAEKLHEKATICAVAEEDKILVMLAGYTENVTGNLGYISIVASLPEARGRGYAEKVIREFLKISLEKGLEAVHLYAVASNTPAVNLYRKIGFEEWKMPLEPRPGDLHLIYRLKGAK